MVAFGPWVHRAATVFMGTPRNGNSGPITQSVSVDPSVLRRKRRFREPSMVKWMR